MKNSIPFPDALEQRLTDDAKRLPAPPSDLHDRIMHQLDHELIEARGSSATPWMACAAAVALLIALGVALKPDASIDAAPLVVYASVPLPNNPVAEANNTLHALLDQPLQTEVQNLTQDMQSATRFLLTSFGDPTSIKGS